MAKHNEDITVSAARIDHIEARITKALMVRDSGTVVLALKPTKHRSGYEFFLSVRIRDDKGNKELAAFANLEYGTSHADEDVVLTDIVVVSAVVNDLDTDVPEATVELTLRITFTETGSTQTSSTTFYINAPLFFELFGCEVEYHIFEGYDEAGETPQFRTERIGGIGVDAATAKARYQALLQQSRHQYKA